MTRWQDYTNAVLPNKVNLFEMQSTELHKELEGPEIVCLVMFLRFLPIQNILKEKIVSS